MNDKPAMANTQAFAVITQDELSSLRAELAELRAREVSAAFKSGDVTRANAALRAATNGHLGVKPAAVPDDVAKDAERLDWLVSEVALVQSLAISPPHGDGTTLYYIVWQEYGEEQRDTYATPREAIDAAILAAKEKGQ